MDMRPQCDGCGDAERCAGRAQNTGESVRMMQNGIHRISSVSHPALLESVYSTVPIGYPTFSEIILPNVQTRSGNSRVILSDELHCRQAVESQVATFFQSFIL
eukprot:scaffold6461_cov48-Attheya_sp.AAC.3